MKKFFLSMLVTIGASWFFPVSFIVGTTLSMNAICHYNHCTRDMERGDSIAPQFQVMVRLPSKDNQVFPVLFTSLKKFSEKNPDASFHVIIDEGKTVDQSWEFSVQSQTNEYQIIEARQLDDVRIDVKYRASNLSVEPLTSKVMSSGVLFSSIPFGLIFAWLVCFFARGIRGRMGIQS
ncbi:hypothetical protein ACO0LD_30510 [Undibacterium sp. Ji83W]|uniref:hypothetical protein n=1 Tax=Undibacterium sp. Ji83W TaxID=3413043 RepID=UPI003BF39E28